MGHDSEGFRASLDTHIARPLSLTYKAFALLLLLGALLTVFAPIPARAHELFVADNNQAMRVYSRTANGDIASTRTAIGGLTELNHLTDLTLGPDGNLYVAGFGANQVLRYNGTTGAFNKKGES